MPTLPGTDTLLLPQGSLRAAPHGVQVKAMRRGGGDITFQGWVAEGARGAPKTLKVPFLSCYMNHHPSQSRDTLGTACPSPREGLRL